MPNEHDELYIRKSRIVQHFYSMFVKQCAETRGGEVDFDGVVNIVNVIGGEIAEIDKPQVHKGRAKASGSTVQYKTDRAVNVTTDAVKKSNRR